MAEKYDSTRVVPRYKLKKKLLQTYKIWRVEVVYFILYGNLSILKFDLFSFCEKDFLFDMQCAAFIVHVWVHQWIRCWFLTCDRNRIKRFTKNDGSIDACYGGGHDGGDAAGALLLSRFSISSIPAAKETTSSPTEQTWVFLSVAGKLSNDVAKNDPQPRKNCTKMSFAIMNDLLRQNTIESWYRSWDW